MSWIDTNKRLTKMEQFAKECFEDSQSDAIGLTLKEAHILNALYEQDCQHASNVARSIGVSPTSFTPTLDKLENRAYIKRMADKTDRRAVFIQLTVKGKSIQPIVQEVLAKVEKEFKGKK